MRYTITAALPYANGPIHIGHLAGVYLPADIYARYLRQTNQDVLFVCGSDEHGAAISMKAKKEGKSPKEIIDEYHHLIKNTFEEFGISFDNYSRTSSSIHHQTASEFFISLYKKGVFEEKVTEHFYDDKANQFLADRYVIGTCPKCGHEEAYGDQCEKCGSSLSGTDLICPKSTLTGNTPILKETTHWFLPLDRYSEFLSDWILKKHNKDWKSNVYGQIKSWIDDGLKPRAVTRDLDWGIPVPLEKAKDKVLYVWFDAPIGYISASKEWGDKNGKDWQAYWKNKDTRLVNFIGKDNIVFHCIIFPSMLKAHGDYILPENVPANEFLNLEGKKLSTSKNWAVWLHEYLEDFPNQKDTLRYVLSSIMPEKKDSDFTWKDFQSRHNSELVAIYGNFVNRVFVLIDKYYKGNVPTAQDLEQIDKETIKTLEKAPRLIANNLNNYRFRDAIQELMNVARLGNKYLADTEPWKCIKTDAIRTQTIMNLAVQIVAKLTILSKPFLPFTSEKLQQALNFNNTIDTSWEGQLIISSGHKIQKLGLLFEKIEDNIIEKQIEKLKTTVITSAETKKLDTIKQTISFDDFIKMDIRVGTIKEATKMPKTNKLLVLQVDIGLEVRTIVSGIAQSFAPEEVIGKKVVVLVNLAPRKLRGVESQGMILMTNTIDGKFSFVSPEDMQNSVDGYCIN